jgi:hypothetical protein
MDGVRLPPPSVFFDLILERGFCNEKYIRLAHFGTIVKIISYIIGFYAGTLFLCLNDPSCAS